MVLVKDTHMQPSEKKPEVETVASYDLLYITRAYNRKEISFDEWLRLSREWAERVIRAYSTDTS
jgi:hypothetical protein